MAAVTLREIVTRWGFDVKDSELIKLQQREKKLRGQFVKLGAIASAALASIVLPAASLEDKLRRSAAAAGKSGGDFEKTLAKITPLAMDFAEEFGIAGGDVATGFFDVISAGVDPLSAGFEKFASTGLALAKVAGGDVGQAIEALKPTMAAFGVSTENALIVADKFAKANQTGATSVAQISEAMTLAAPVMAQTFGQTLDTTTALLIGFAEAGFKGRRGGEALKQTALVLAAPTTRAAAALKELGIQTTNSDGSFKNIIKIIEQFETNLKGMSDAQKAATLEQIFGRETVAKFSALLGIGTKELRKFETASSESDGALALSIKQMEGTTEAFRKVVEAVKNLAATFGAPLLKPIKKMLDAFRGIVRHQRNLLQENPKMLKLVSTIFGLVAAVVILGSAFGVAFSTIKIMTAGMKLLGIATLKAQVSALLLPFAIAAALILLGFLIHDLIVFFQGGESEIGRLIMATQEWKAELSGLVAVAGVLLLAFLIAFAPLLVLFIAIIALVALIIKEWDKLSLFWEMVTDDWRGTFKDFTGWLKELFGLTFDNIIKEAANLDKSIAKFTRAQLPDFVADFLDEVSPIDEPSAVNVETQEDRLARVARLGIARLGQIGVTGGVTPPATDFARNQVNNANKTSTTTINAPVTVNAQPGQDSKEIAEEVVSTLVRHTQNSLAK